MAMGEEIKKTLFSCFGRDFFAKPCFLIIGSQKCGTTSLYNYLIQHPQVVGASRKEIHYFDIEFSKGFAWYKKHFSIPKSLHSKKGLVTGEATPYYIFHPHAPVRAKETLPDVKLIAMLRDPVERAFSHHKHHVKLKVETLPFEEAVRAESERLNGEMEKMLQDENYNSYNLQMFSYLARGVYADQLERWLKWFPRDQILILKSEDFFCHPETSFIETLDFLGLPEYRLKSYRKFNAGGNQSMPNGIRRYLTDYFKPHNERLYELVGKDLAW